MSLPTVRAETNANGFRGYEFYSGPDVPVEDLVILDVNSRVAYINIDENARCSPKQDDFEDDNGQGHLGQVASPRGCAQTRSLRTHLRSHVRSQALGGHPSALFYWAGFQ